MLISSKCRYGFRNEGDATPPSHSRESRDANGGGGEETLGIAT
jgi:hypothetical protein